MKIGVCRIPVLSMFCVAGLLSGLSGISAYGQVRLAGLYGLTRFNGSPVPEASVVARNLNDDTARVALSGSDGSFRIAELTPGRYEVTAKKDGAGVAPPRTVELQPEESLNVDAALNAPDPNSAAAPLVPVTAEPAPRNFFRRFLMAYSDDWKGIAPNEPEPKYRGYRGPVAGPPFAFSIWRYGGSVVIGQPWTQAALLMAAIWGGKNGTGGSVAVSKCTAG